jgi:hypothetical protein
MAKPMMPHWQILPFFPGKNNYLKNPSIAGYV